MISVHITCAYTDPVIGTAGYLKEENLILRYGINNSAVTVFFPFRLKLCAKNITCSKPAGGSEVVVIIPVVVRIVIPRE